MRELLCNGPDSGKSHLGVGLTNDKGVESGQTGGERPVMDRVDSATHLAAARRVASSNKVPMSLWGRANNESVVYHAPEWVHSEGRRPQTKPSALPVVACRGCDRVAPAGSNAP